ncbi:hypothetical protein, variant 4 [Blastomyces gilchristii SLH14081]|uniref:Uncharacterized protein n=1 Tax=Blastomyces gilchristii (strain SLH14081) TaxID=559298 RepID=A0A179V171_BLAGS|nr:uncharacterized protein BDBG_07706 [Blastomyces gilchristii SLH14081]XP_031580336.1 hypothetical protein, variant 1 [Blastomyces gilchristii SLH14081]XP_031580337.1 hypothetical protein, variant 2 [Blastomyces gilchristii SLH14081]XP_031580338.1 hypothetical protein, variant 3 [Blastomyces gilchristii SLH14081]XP_031580339.1 hypothetical protein, variant 4 [Blastomyces gilchristii SLH14081]OAT12352.1 hypothetical protein BDBG_07706 [Blastomyces gilchristii SLH14081]OAT12353.1 hypothetical 
MGRSPGICQSSRSPCYAPYTECELTRDSIAGNGKKHCIFPWRIPRDKESRRRGQKAHLFIRIFQLPPHPFSDMRKHPPVWYDMMEGVPNILLQAHDFIQPVESNSAFRPRHFAHRSPTPSSTVSKLSPKANSCLRLSVPPKAEFM